MPVTSMGALHYGSGPDMRGYPIAFMAAAAPAQAEAAKAAQRVVLSTRRRTVTAPTLVASRVYASRAQPCASHARPGGSALLSSFILCDAAVILNSPANSSGK
jgi:hypothetical protein